MKKYVLIVLLASFIFPPWMAAMQQANKADQQPHIIDSPLGRLAISTLPVDPGLTLRSSTFTPSGKVLVTYFKEGVEDRRDINLAVMDDDGSNMQTFFSGKIPPREKDNGIRFMVFADNTRVFLGDFIVECIPNLDACEESTLLPVEYPEQVAGGDHILNRWSEIIIAPDNEHIAWTTLFSNYSAAVFTGKLLREEKGYRIVKSQMITTPAAFREDPAHPDGVIPNPVRNGEVKQFVHGGTGISMVGAKHRDTADSVVLHLSSGQIEQVTHHPAYDETTIFSADERLGIVMSARFSEASNLAVLGLMPRPYPDSLNMGLNTFAYTYSVTGVRRSRPGDIGPALVEIQPSKSAGGDYLGANLSTDPDWVYSSPISWQPSSKKGMWHEGFRDGKSFYERKRRIQIVHLLDYEPAKPVAPQSTPSELDYAASDLSAVYDFLEQANDVDVKVYGKHSGHIEFRRNSKGFIEKRYLDFSDDGRQVYSGVERMQRNPMANSTYTADVTLSGPEPGRMDLKITFGSLNDELPARLIFDKDEAGVPLSHGFAEFGGQRLLVENLVP